MHWRQHIKVSIAQIQRNQVVHTYEAFFSGMDESGAAALKELPEFARVGEYYLLGQEHFIQGYNASNVYCGSDMMYIARSQMELVKGRFPELKGEKETNPFVVAVSRAALAQWPGFDPAGYCAYVYFKNDRQLCF